MVLVRWDSDLLEQAAEAGNFLPQEDGIYRLRPMLIQALRNRALKVYGRERVKEFKYDAAHYYEMHDEIVPALKLFEECGKTERIKSLLIRNARMNPGSGYYYELRRCLTKVRCCLANGEYTKAQALLEKMRYYAERMDRAYIRMETGLLSS